MTVIVRENSITSVGLSNDLEIAKQTVSQSGATGECLLFAFIGLAVMAVVVILLTVIGCAGV